MIGTVGLMNSNERVINNNIPLPLHPADNFFLNEQNIIQKSKDSSAIMIKIMDLSKWIQVELIKELLNKRRYRKLSIIT
jgi:hypothetical protein